jgi:hypothetical protein
LIKSLLLREIGANRRVLVCFDFAYGYPVDFAAALQAATGKSDRDLPWLIVWRYLSDVIKDGTAPGARYPQARLPVLADGKRSKCPRGRLWPCRDLL